MNRFSKLRSVGLSLLVPAIVAAAVPFTFTSGTPIRASEVNANFASLEARLGAPPGATRWVAPTGETLTVVPLPIHSAYRSSPNSSGIWQPAIQTDAGVWWGAELETGRARPLVGPESSINPALWYESTDCTGRPIISGAIPPPGGTITLEAFDAGILARRLNSPLRPLAIRSIGDGRTCGATSNYSLGLLMSDFTPATPPTIAPGPYHPQM